MTLPTDRLPSVVVAFAPTAKQWPAVTMKRWPPRCTMKPDEHTEPPLLIELPPQNGELSARRREAVADRPVLLLDDAV